MLRLRNCCDTVAVSGPNPSLPHATPKEGASAPLSRPFRSLKLPDDGGGPRGDGCTDVV